MPSLQATVCALLDRRLLLICSMCGERERLYLVAQPGDARAPAGSFTVCTELWELLRHSLPSKRLKEEGLLLPPAVSPSVWLLLSEMAHRKGAGTPLQPLRKCCGLTHCLKPFECRDTVHVMTGISFSFLKESQKVLGMKSVMKIMLTAKRCLSSSEQCLHTS